MAFTDNEGVFGSFVKGHSDNSSRAPLIEFFARCEESLETISWIDRVPSLYCCPIQQNLSRGQVVNGAPRANVELELLARALPGVFG